MGGHHDAVLLAGVCASHPRDDHAHGLYCATAFSMRRRLFHFLATSEIVAKINYCTRITFIFVAVLFIDAFQRMMKVAAESETAERSQGFQDFRSESNYYAKKFYAQHNVYLTGFTLFMSLILSRTHSLVLDLINAQEELASN